MARNISADRITRVFRAVIEKQYGNHTDGKVVTSYEGPYVSKGAAMARVTFWTNRLGADRTKDRWAYGDVEEGTVTWGPVGGQQ